MTAKRRGSRASNAGAKPKSKSPRKKKTGTKRARTGGRLSKWTPDARAKFLAELADHGMVTIAAATIPMSRTMLYQFRKDDEGFKQEWDDAIESSYDRLEEEARRRAERGVLKPVYQGGSKVGHVREFSDSLMSLLLRARRRKVFSEKAQTGQLDGGDAGTGVLKVGGVRGEDDWEEEYGT